MGFEHPYFGFKKDRATTQKLWERFNCGLIVPEELTDPYQRLLVDEWRRFAEQGLDVRKKVGQRPDREDLQSRLHEDSELLSAARPIIDRVSGTLTDVPGILILADGSGSVLHIAGNQDVRALAAERTWIVEGSCWAESLAGNNGLGSALSKRRPVHVYSTEHFCEGWHAWTCAATPIVEPGGSHVWGAIDFTTIAKDYRDQAVALTCSLARAIQAELQLGVQLEKNYLLQHFRSFAKRNPTLGVVCLDRRNRVVGASLSETGRRLLGRDAERFVAGAERLPVIMPATGRCSGSLCLVHEPEFAPHSAECTSALALPGTGSELRTPRDADPRLGCEEPAVEGRREPKDALTEYEVIFDNAIVGILYTRDRMVARCNRRFEEMFGYARGELTGQSVEVLYPSHELYDRAGQHYEQLLVQHAYSDERVMRRKDGELFWCNVEGKVLDLQNPRHGAIWIFQDISTRKHAEEALQRANERLEQRVQERTAELSKANETLRAEMEMRQVAEQALTMNREKYRVLFETLPIGLSITDEQGEVIEVNRSFTRLASQAAQSALVRDLGIAGGSVIDAHGNAITREQLPSARALREGRAIHDVEIGIRYPNGKVRWFSVTAAPIPVKGYGAVTAHTEITERKRSEALERQQRADLARVSRVHTMGEMAAALAHELGQPLSATLNYLHGCQIRLEDGSHDRELLRSAVSQAIHHAEQAGSIVKHVRQFVRRHEPETVPTDINALIRETVAFLGFELRDCKVALQLSLGESVPTLLLEPLEIKQVIVNLVKNGIDAMTETAAASRQLEIATRCRGRHWIEVAVSDRGLGIANKDAARIFDAFYSTKRNGLGLGLAICRTIVESHGGRISATRNVYGGATFSFRVPVAGGAL